MWDEAWGQRPWKAFQEQWKDRYSAFLNTAKSKSATSEKTFEQNPRLRRAQAEPTTRVSGFQSRRRRSPQETRRRQRAPARGAKRIHRPARVRKRTHLRDWKPAPALRRKQASRKKSTNTKRRQATVEFPDGSKKEFNFEELEETYNDIRDERTKLSLELGDVLKPVTAAKAKMDEYISDHMVDLTPAADRGLEEETTEWDPAIVQINVADANIVDRCESCHMNTREPLKITAAAMTAKGEKKPDEYANAFVSHPEPELLKIHDPEKFGCSPCHQGNGRATTSVEKGSRKLRALAVAALSQREFAGGLPDLPLRRHGAGQRRYAVSDHQRRQRSVPAARLHGLPSLRGLRQGTRGPELGWAADQADRDPEKRQHQADTRT